VTIQTQVNSIHVLKCYISLRTYNLPAAIIDEITNLKLHFSSNTFIWSNNFIGFHPTNDGFSWLLFKSARRTCHYCILVLDLASQAPEKKKKSNFVCGWFITTTSLFCHFWIIGTLPSMLFLWEILLLWYPLRSQM